jgi:GH43 family beta-xylosidase
VPGLRGVYYRGALDAVVDRVDTNFDISWDGEPAPGVGADDFAVRWTGTLVPPAPGMYAFALDADDGARLWIGGTNVFDVWKAGVNTIDFTPVTLSGPTPIKLTYYDQAGPARLRLRWRRPDGTEEVVPASALLAEAAPNPPLPSPPPPYTNSVLPSGCADPGALAVDGTYYVVCTGGRFRINTSRDLVHWTASSSYILPSAGPPWSSSTMYRWAPEIHPVGTGYVAYFVSADGSGQRAIGTASAPAPMGPYTLQGAPLVTNPIGVIDPTYFEDDDGKQYLLWKVAGNSSGQPTPIFVRELSADGLSFASGSTAKELIRNDPSTYEGPVVEAPWMLKRNGTYYLFYSANNINQNYRVGVARASSVMGPYTKHSGPIVGNNAKWVGPGHNSSVQIDGVDYMVYHAYNSNGSGGIGSGGRVLMVDRIDWVGGWPQIDGGAGSPSMSARPRPGTDPDAP